MRGIRIACRTDRSGDNGSHLVPELARGSSKYASGNDSFRITLVLFRMRRPGERLGLKGGVGRLKIILLQRRYSAPQSASSRRFCDLQNRRSCAVPCGD
jgi:hypothetical protein